MTTPSSLHQTTTLEEVFRDIIQNVGQNYQAPLALDIYPLRAVPAFDFMENEATLSRLVEPPNHTELPRSPEVAAYEIAVNPPRNTEEDVVSPSDPTGEQNPKANPAKGVGGDDDTEAAKDNNAAGSVGLRYKDDWEEVPLPKVGLDYYKHFHYFNEKKPGSIRTSAKPSSPARCLS